MKNKKLWLLILVFLVLFAVVIFVLIPKDETKNEDAPNNIPFEKEPPAENQDITIDTVSEAPNPVTMPDKAHVYVVNGGWLSLRNTEELEVKNGPWPSELSKDTRFVLLPFDKKVSDDERKQLKKWVDNEISVLFYGKDVDAQAVLDTLGIDKEPVELESNAELRHIAYGYGYSEGYDAHFPLFVNSNAEDVESLTSYISQFLYKNRGF